MDPQISENVALSREIVDCGRAPVPASVLGSESPKTWIAVSFTFGPGRCIRRCWQRCADNGLAHPGRHRIPSSFRAASNSDTPVARGVTIDGVTMVTQPHHIAGITEGHIAARQGCRGDSDWHAATHKNAGVLPVIVGSTFQKTDAAALDKS